MKLRAVVRIPAFGSSERGRTADSAGAVEEPRSLRPDDNTVAPTQQWTEPPTPAVLRPTAGTRDGSPLRYRCRLGCRRRLKTAHCQSRRSTRRTELDLRPLIADPAG